jgi:O-antigen/teichoic acid export membrane protein
MAARLPVFPTVGRLGRSTIYTSMALALRAAMQAAYLILLSRWMGPADYGVFAGSVAAAVLLAPLSGWGMPYLLSDRVARSHASASWMWPSALVQTIVSGIALGAPVVLATLAMRRSVGPSGMLLLVASELVAVPVMQAASTLLLAMERGAVGSVVICFSPIARLLLVVVFLATGGTLTPFAAVGLHFVGTIAGAATTMLVVRRIVGPASWRSRAPLFQTARSGTHYAVGSLVGSSYMEVDKLLLLQLVGAAPAGLYTTAFRVAAVFAIPVAALTNNALPRLFAADHPGAWRRVYKAVAIAGGCYGVAATIMAFGLAPAMPLIFGSAFLPASGYLLLLAPWPLLYALHQVAATGLTSRGRQGLRVAIETTGLLAVVVLDLLLLPRIGPKAAPWVLVATEAFLVIGCWTLLFRESATSDAPHVPR